MSWTRGSSTIYLLYQVLLTSYDSDRHGKSKSAERSERR
jgi:hypothetical protein